VKTDCIMRIKLLPILGTLCGFIWLGTRMAGAWDYEGHHIINRLALASLPADFPSFALAPSQRERIAFLAGEPDRWRNSDESALRHVNSPDHYIDLEELALYGLTPETLPPLRYDFVARLALCRAAHPEKFPQIDPDKNRDHTRQLVGFLPWTITEYYAKLKSEFSYLKAFQEAGGTPEEIANAQANVIYTMGAMGHFVGDATQPLHTTVHFNGWTGENPRHYTTDRAFHAWIDGGYIAKVNVEGDFDEMRQRLRAARVLAPNNHPVQPEEMFQTVVAFIGEQNKLVEPLYQLEKDHKLSGDDPLGMQGKPFIEGQLLKAGQMLGDIWYSAWQQAPVDGYLKRELEARHASQTGGQKN
jgi:hypothetical protein